MATVRIEQYAAAGIDAKAVMQMPTLPMAAAALEYTSSGTSQNSSALDDKTRMILVRSTGGAVAVSILRSGTITATTGAGVNDGEARWFALNPADVGKAAVVAIIDRS